MRRFLSSQKFAAALFIGLIVTGISMQYVHTVQADIAKSLVRLHIIANSDGEDDQALKLKVRDGVIEYLSDKVGTAQTPEETKAILRGELKNIAECAQSELLKNGYGYSVTVQLGNFDFPTKHYEGAALPAGSYDALRIIIGSGEGKNWWCVLFPQLCFTSEGSGGFSEESRQKLKNMLTDDEYNIVTESDSGDIPVKIKFRILEIFGR